MPRNGPHPRWGRSPTLPANRATDGSALESEADTGLRAPIILLPLDQCDVKRDVLQGTALYAIKRFLADSRTFKDSAFKDISTCRYAPFDWKFYIRSLPTATREVVEGCGITSFCIKARRLIPPTDDVTLADFVAYRADGSAVRVRPHGAQVEVCYIEAPQSNPWYKGELARTEKHSGGLAQGTLWPGVVRCTLAGLCALADSIGRPAARAFLDGISSTAGLVDLTDGSCFAWPRWLCGMSSEDKLRVVGEGIVKVCALSPGTVPFFIVEQLGGTTVAITPGSVLHVNQIFGPTIYAWACQIFTARPDLETPEWLSCVG